jgi:N-acetylmuramoyl-L-alanine amidase
MKGLIQITMLCLVAMAATAAAQGGKEVYRISIAERADGHGFVVRLHTNGKVRPSDLTVRQDDLRYAEIMLTDATIASEFQKDEVVGPIRGYSVERASGGVRIRLSLDPDQPVQIVAYGDSDSDDALIALTYAPVSPRSPTPAVKLVSTTIEPELVESPNSPIAGEAWKLDCVVIDAGHGGKDPGAVANGVREKDVNLAVAKKLGFYIEDRLGLRVVYTRDDDRFISLKERGRIANDDCGKLFISLHVNAARRKSANGTEIYFLGLHKSDAAHDVMERENSVIRLEEDPGQYVDLSSEQAILTTMAQSVYLNESENLAELLQFQFSNKAMRPTRGVKQAGFLVLWKASMPAILVELGFITNKDEAKYLKSSRGHDLLASAIFRAVRSYRDYYQRGFEWTVSE